MPLQPKKPSSAETALVNISVKISKAENDELETLIHQGKLEGILPRSFSKSDLVRDAIKNELPLFRERLSALRRKERRARPD
jgi:hypothetical protein